MRDLAAGLAESPRGYVVAPAGCGKTQMIALAVREEDGRPQLVLTHTHAGVQAIRRRLANLDVPRTAYRVDTIAGWALTLASAYPGTSRLVIPEPTGAAWNEVYEAAVRVLQLRAIRAVISASYAGVYVDEYQDCSVGQHGMVLALAEIMPCRVLGDPLQGIFNFRSEPSVDWDRHVVSEFAPLKSPRVPYRWARRNPQLGEWVQQARTALLARQPLTIRPDSPVRWIRAGGIHEQLGACRAAARQPGTTVVIRGRPHQCINIGRQLAPMFSVIEAVDLQELFNVAVALDETAGVEAAKAILDFVASCITGLKSHRERLLRGLEGRGRKPLSPELQSALSALRGVANECAPATIQAALGALCAIPKCSTFRRDPLHELRYTIQRKMADPGVSYRDAAWRVRDRTRTGGARLPRLGIGTTLRIKGLEFDHAIVIGADEADFDCKNLYVALTRACESLTVISREPVIG